MPETPPIYFLILGIVGLFGAAITYSRVRAGKPGTFALPLAFLAFSGVAYAIYFRADDWVRNAAIGVLVVLLAADLLLKAQKHTP